jgi:hypothetical protein
MRACVFSGMFEPAFPLRTSETAVTETWARSATSLRSGRLETLGIRKILLVNPFTNGDPRRSRKTGHMRQEHRAARQRPDQFFTDGIGDDPTCRVQPLASAVGHLDNRGVDRYSLVRSRYEVLPAQRDAIESVIT